MTGLELWMIWTSISECEIPPVEMATNVAVFVGSASSASAVLAIAPYGMFRSNTNEPLYVLFDGREVKPLNPSIVRALKRRATNTMCEISASSELIAWAKSP